MPSPTDAELAEMLAQCEECFAVMGPSQYGACTPCKNLPATIHALQTFRAQDAAKDAEMVHDPWTKDDGHNWLFCDHPTCKVVRGYERELEQKDAELVGLREAVLRVDEHTNIGGFAVQVLPERWASLVALAKGES
jgi:hypothetical protein